VISGHVDFRRRRRRRRVIKSWWKMFKKCVAALRNTRNKLPVSRC